MAKSQNREERKKRAKEGRKREGGRRAKWGKDKSLNESSCEFVSLCMWGERCDVM